ncbi:MAG TPA: recombination protein O N-terminal domain-containing protein [Candidatus Paceibacterota bacterium]|nr:recombination protein O N-terminal domain-containing protein [Candidatus Paceibacterota bacterium]
MRHKYVTEAVVLGHTAAREQAATVTLLTRDLGLIRARAEGFLKPASKMAHALQTLSACEATLVRGKDTWRLTGALLTDNRFLALDRSARLRAARVTGLLLRLVQGEHADTELFEAFEGFLAALPGKGEEAQDALECLAALRMLRSLGLDTARLPEGGELYESSALEAIEADRADVIRRINRGIAASGL